MQAIILAAGMGIRLRPFTDDIPKALVPVHGVPLILGMLSVLAQEDIAEIIVVIGYQGEKIRKAVGTEYKGIPIIYVENPFYASTNNIYSLFLAQHYITEDAVLLECDLLITGGTIHSLVQSQADCNILVSSYDQKTMDGTVVLLDKKGAVRELVVKKFQGEDFDYTSAYKTVNIYKFRKEFLKNKFFPALNLYVQTQGRDIYYELVLGSLIYFHTSDITITNISPSLWYEIDNSDDLKRAEASAIPK